ncbi:DUF2834 domain-containing protein [Arthrobacter agilis]|uniref:DUF2834 domain-containing protein n=1 Tax=Arthrobacter agilis TaxID=37921 RepID=UPI002366D6F9|nr:DUF2834 domain-containing protein [Arthrobacter agilis]WDF32938.1 DUF2834 domain-containing protein [Arthrobacter agilis]
MNTVHRHEGDVRCATSTWFSPLSEPSGHGPSTSVPSRASDDYLAGWFATAASSSAAVDVIVVAIVACLFMVVEGKSLGMSRAVWLLVPLSFVIAVAATFPLFLAWREHHLERTAHRAGPVRAEAVAS